MAFKNEVVSGIEQEVQGYYEPSVVTYPEEVIPNTEPTVTTVVFNDPEKFVSDIADPCGSHLSNAPEADNQLLTRPIIAKAVPFRDEAISGSYDLAELGGKTETQIQITAKTWVAADGTDSDATSGYQTVQQTLTGVKKGTNVIFVDVIKDYEVVITPEAALLTQYNPLVDVDGKWSDYKVLEKGMTFHGANRDHRISIHWTQDCVETFYFISKL